MKLQYGGIGGYETAVVVFITIVISSMSVCVAFLIYRAVKGQRGKNHTSHTVKEGNSRGDEEEEEDWSKSTESGDGASEDEVDSSESVILEQTPSKHLLEGLSVITHETMNDSSIQHTVGETSKNECHMKPSQTETMLKNSIKESTHEAENIEIEPQVDIDEPSETESAQETLEANNFPVYKCQSVEDLLDNTLLTQEAVNKSSEKEKFLTDTQVSNISSDAQQEKTDEMDTENKVHKNVSPHILQINDFESCCNEESDLGCNVASEKAKHKEDIKGHQVFSHHTINLEVTNKSFVSQQHPSNKYDLFPDPKQSYFGCATTDMHGESSAIMQLPDTSKKTTEDATVEVKKKDEISIMEAIMDSNEWLSVGPPDTRDMSWITASLNNTNKEFEADMCSSQAPTNNCFGLNTDEKKSDQEKTGVSMVLPEVMRDTGDLVSKIVDAVLPMPQQIRVNFRVHYITHSPYQILAVTGNLQELGAWDSFVSLRNAEDGFWFCTIELPLDSQVEWKFVMVEEGQVRRWEECGNRHLVVTCQEEEINLNKNWGYA